MAKLLFLLAVMIVGMAASSGAQDRMPPIPDATLTDAQKKAIAEFKAARSVDISGPFVPMLRSPEVMSRARAMGDYLRYKSSLPPRLSEFVILLTARRWTQQYEWHAHQPLALQGGLQQPSRRRRSRRGGGRRRMADDEDAVYTLWDEMQRNQSVSDATYARAVGEARRAGRDRRARHHRLLHDAGDGDEHDAHAAARRRRAAAGAAAALADDQRRAEALRHADK